MEKVQSVSPSETVPISFEKVWDLFLPLLKTKVKARALELAAEDGRESPYPPDVMQALKEYFPGHPVPGARGNWFYRNITGFMVVTAAMTVIFGILGLMPQTGNQGFLEITKIFAGALVGGAAGAAYSGKR